MTTTTSCFVWYNFSLTKPDKTPLFYNVSVRATLPASDHVDTYEHTVLYIEEMIESKNLFSKSCSEVEVENKVEFENVVEVENQVENEDEVEN